MDRRDFLRFGFATGSILGLRSTPAAVDEQRASGPVVVSTHPSGVAANHEALAVLAAGGTALDAAERGVMVVEADPEDTSVGYGGYPNSAGVVELDAAIMNGRSLDAGAVGGLQDIKHPVAVARKVMDETAHVFLVGEGARRFALSHGFKKERLLTPEAKEAWREHRRSRDADRGDGHDTIGMVVLASDGSMAASCTTSGLAWKLPGRVGDSPLIGAGLYCDETAGGAVATGVGEEIIKLCGSHQVVELMRQGRSAEQAARQVLHRILKRNPDNRDRFIGLLALRGDGDIGCASTTEGFKIAIAAGGAGELREAPRI